MNDNHFSSSTRVRIVGEGTCCATAGSTQSRARTLGGIPGRHLGLHRDTRRGHPPRPPASDLVPTPALLGPGANTTPSAPPASGRTYPPSRWDTDSAKSTRTKHNEHGHVPEPTLSTRKRHAPRSPGQGGASQGPTAPLPTRLTPA